MCLMNFMLSGYLENSLYDCRELYRNFNNNGRIFIPFKNLKAYLPGFAGVFDGIVDGGNCSLTPEPSL